MLLSAGLLNDNEESARKSLGDLEQGIAVVRDQITTTEVMKVRGLEVGR